MIRSPLKSLALALVPAPVLALVLAAGSASAFAQSTAFTYQGKLTGDSQTVSTPADVSFSLFTAAIGGTQVGSTVTRNAVTVLDGVFSTAVDFGVNPYTSGQDLFLEIAVRNPAGSGVFVTLVPRQLLTPAPFSLATRGLNIDAAGNLSLLPGGNRTIRVPSEPASVPGGSNGKNLSIIAGNSSVPSSVASKGGSLLLQAGLGNNIDQSFAGGGDVILRSGANNASSLTTVPNGGSILFETGGRFGAITEQMRLTDRGALGLGIAAPAYKLHVVGSGASTDNRAPYGMFETTDGTFGPQVRLKHGGAGGQDWVMASAGSGNGDAGSFLLLRSGSSVVPFAINSSDNVGIGTTSPSARLHNAGTTRLDGQVQFGAQTWNGTTGSNVNLTRFSHSAGNGSNVVLDMSSSVASAFLIQNNGVGMIYLDSTGAAGKPGGGAWTALSDERTKNNIQPLTGTLDRLLRLSGHCYSYKPEFVEAGRALPGVQVGLVAQEVETVFPDWVSTGPDGLKSVTERSTTALMVEALRDLRTEKDAEIATLKARLEKIEAMLAATTAAAGK